MKVEIHCKGMPLTDAVRDHVHEKLGKVTRLLPGEIEILTILGHNPGQQGGVYTAEISFRAWGHDVVAKESDEDMYKAVSSAIEQVLTQTRKFKEKRKTRQKGGESVRGYEPPTSASPEVEDDFDDEMDIEQEAAVAPTTTPPSNPS